ncbi:MAG: hypothetical protein M1816_005894 [Peltula sp. TS41687]|nr:MAG: hypothetical protein M1816_005894 [Peltula sp. TS41687]
MFRLPILIVLLAAFLVVYKCIWFAFNVKLARRTGLPYVLSPIHELENWAYITNAVLRWLYNDALLKGNGWPRRLRYMIKDFHYEDKYRAHTELGDVFLVVSPGGIVCYCADAKMAMDVCTRRKDFVKPREKMKLIEPFGPNVVSSEGSLWRTHVRITAPPFGDAANRLVWAETARQTSFLLQSWARKGSDALKSEIYLLGVNVMAYAGFGQQFDWTDDKRAIPHGHTLSLIDAIFQLILFLPHVLLLPKWLLKRSPWKAGYQAYIEFSKYIAEFIHTERMRIDTKSVDENKVKGNLLTALLRENVGEVKTTEPLAMTKTALTDEEVTGNMFMFLMAGYDTTANSIIYSSVNLVLYPEIQEQVIEEIDNIYAEAQKEGRTELTYTDDFRKFRYLLAFLYEVLRVYPVVLPIGRMTLQEQSITVGSNSVAGPASTLSDRTYILPPQCGLIVNNTGIHHNERFWPHPYVLEPRRWLSSNPNLYDPCSPVTQNEKVSEQTTYPSMWAPNAMKGSFMTFSEGARACMGRKFAQAEYVAFFAHILRRNRLKLGGDRSRDDIERSYRLRSAGSPVTLAPPEDVTIIMEPRVVIY